MREVDVSSGNFWVCRRCGWHSDVATGAGWTAEALEQLRLHIQSKHPDTYDDLSYLWPCMIFRAYQSTSMIGFV